LFVAQAERFPSMDRPVRYLAQQQHLTAVQLWKADSVCVCEEKACDHAVPDCRLVTDGERGSPLAAMTVASPFRLTVSAVHGAR
jgi:hypothetical protein